jgi:hypothetical protein
VNDLSFQGCVETIETINLNPAGQLTTTTRLSVEFQNTW